MNRGPNTVFVGNIPYGATEEEIGGLLEQVGPVADLRIVYDKESGKPKGFGFCEYRDAETAASAIRNLTDLELHGRVLRIAESDTRTQGHAGRDRERDGRGPPGGDGGGGDGGGGGMAPRGIEANIGGGAAGAFSEHQQLPPPPSQQQQQQQQQRVPAQAVQPLMLPGGKATLSGLTLQQIYNVLHELKVLGQTNPDEVRGMLQAHPPLAHAILQAQVLLGMVSVQQAQQHLQGLLQAQGETQQAPAPAPPPPPPKSSPPLSSAPSAAAPVPGASNYADGGRQHGRPPPPPPPPPQQQQQQQHQQASPPPPPPHQQPQYSAQNMQQEAVLRQLMSLTPEQISQLPPDQRQQVTQLQQQMHSGGGGGR